MVTNHVSIGIMYLLTTYGIRNKFNYYITVEPTTTGEKNPYFSYNSVVFTPLVLKPDPSSVSCNAKANKTLFRKPVELL